MRSWSRLTWSWPTSSLTRPSPSKGWSSVPRIPRSRWAKLRIAAVDALLRKVGDADEIVEIELGHRPPDAQLRVPAAARFPVERQARLEEFEAAVLDRVAAHLQMREFVIEPAVEAQSGDSVLPTLT